MPRSRSTDLGLSNHPLFALSDPCAEDTPVVSLEALLQRTPLLKAVVVPQRARTHPSETPIQGEGAIDRWLALHDRARELRAVVRPGDSVGERQQVQRAIRSLFLYEHVITPKTRWQARCRLWERDRLENLPAFVEQLRWTQCRCARCQPGASSQQPVGQHPWSGTRSA
jgi:hypothetical protein